MPEGLERLLGSGKAGSVLNQAMPNLPKFKLSIKRNVKNIIHVKNQCVCSELHLGNP